MRRFLQNAGLLILFCLLQTLVFERIQLGPFLSPCVYLLFILLFPFGYNTLLLLLWSFAMGVSVDLFSTGVIGVHASAATFLALLRSGILKIVTTKGDVEQLSIPSPRTLSTPWYIVYVATSLLIHHTVLFGLEMFRFSYFALTLLRIGFSTILNTLLITLIHATFFNQRRISDS